ncbi:MAG: hypothetical protein ACREP6_14945 [Candidatus Binataceae bacterium]
MNFKKAGFVISIAFIGMASIALAADAHGFRGRQEHGPSAMIACLVVMPPHQKTELKQTFSSHKQQLKSAWRNVASAKKALNSDLISASGKVSKDQSDLSSAQFDLLKAKDALATDICGKLSARQKTAAAQLYTNLTDLHEKSREQEHNYFKAATAAAGIGAAKTSGASHK